MSWAVVLRLQSMLWSGLHCARGERAGGCKQLPPRRQKQGPLESAVGDWHRRICHRKEEWQVSCGNISKSWLNCHRSLRCLDATFSATPFRSERKHIHIVRVSSVAVFEREAIVGGTATTDYPGGECVHAPCGWRERVATRNQPTSATHPDYAFWLLQISHAQSQSCTYVFHKPTFQHLLLCDALIGTR